MISEMIGQTVKVLDHGYVKLVDVMPHPLSWEEGETADHAIVKAARVSYQKGTTKKSTDKGLIDYLVRNWHTSPLEQVEFKFELCLPISVERQLVRHRTASLNIESSRYSVIEDQFYLPGYLRVQSKDNKQGSSDESLDSETEKMFLKRVEANQIGTYELYEDLIENDVAREVARDVLPLSTYVHMVWKCDLLNLLKMLRLRTDGHAQSEIREYANVMLKLIRPFVPWTVEAAELHWFNSITLNKNDFKYLDISIKEESTNNRSFTEKKSKLERLIADSREDSDQKFVLPPGPALAVDVILSVVDLEDHQKSGIFLIERLYEPYGYALPGGHVDVGETLLQAAVRELKEEVSLECRMSSTPLFIRDEPDRDPRGHVISAVFKGTLYRNIWNSEIQRYEDNNIEAKASSDAKNVRFFTYEELEKIVKDESIVFAFDHRDILDAYLWSSRYS